MKKRKFNIPLKLINAIVIIFVALLFIIGYSLRAIKNSDYFNIEEIITNEGNTIDLSYLKGNNIFSLDLINESKNILSVYPSYSSIKLVRILPNRIFANFIKRKPIALVKLYRYFALDENGVFFNPREQQIESLELPVITGLETKIFGAKPGKAYNIRELVLALHIIKEIKRNRLLKNYRIKKIDVANIANTSMFLLYPLKIQDTRSANGSTTSFDKLRTSPERSRGTLTIGTERPFDSFHSLRVVPSAVEGRSRSAKVSRGLGELEVRLGKDKIKDKLVILAGLIGASRNDLANIKYIDLRFKEAVIKFK